MNKFYVYGLINPIDNTLIYVGKGSSDRNKKHIKLAKTNNKKCKHNPHLYNKLKQILRNGYKDVEYNGCRTINRLMGLCGRSSGYLNALLNESKIVLYHGPLNEIEREFRRAKSKHISEAALSRHRTIKA